MAQLTIYVYRVNDHEYGAGFGLQGCKRLGEIVEQWPIATPKDAKFVASHGTAYWKASDQVSKLADLACELLTRDPTFDYQPPQAPRIEVKPLKPRRSWFGWLRGEAT